LSAGSGENVSAYRHLQSAINFVETSWSLSACRKKSSITSQTPIRFLRLEPSLTGMPDGAPVKRLPLTLPFQFRSSIFVASWPAIREPLQFVYESAPNHFAIYGVPKSNCDWR
jgi:hypothetical protein